jgi:hypothetical protein
MSTPLAPLHGPEHAVPWPTPPIPGTVQLTFWGTGDATTEFFALASDASVRMAVETGPLEVRVLREDGTSGADLAPVPTGCLALGAIPEAGTYRLEVRATGNWGVTIVFMPPRAGVHHELSK